MFHNKLYEKKKWNNYLFRDERIEKRLSTSISNVNFIASEQFKLSIKAPAASFLLLLLLPFQVQAPEALAFF